MATISRFEDIEAWQKARLLSKRIYQLTAAGKFARDFGLRDQIRRASVSIMANIAEGFGRSGSAEFKQYLSTAKGSAAEVQSHLYVASDAGLIGEDEFKELYDLADETARMIGGFLKYLRQSNIRGAKFK